MRRLWSGLALWSSLSVAVPIAAQDLSSEQQAAMAAADIVILGEVHDNAAHHAGQARLLAQVMPKAVVFEMLTPAQAEVANKTSRDDLERFAEVLDWESSGWPDFALYAPIFEALGETPVVGAAAHRSDVRAAFTDGAAAVFGPGAEAFGLDAPPPPALLERRKALQFEAHCAAMPMEMMGGMVEAQRFRDARFSDRALRALVEYGSPVVVIAGHGHARCDWGIPAMLAQADPSVRVYTVGFVEHPNPAEDPRFHMTVVTEAAVRGDPCAAFKK